MASAAGLKIQPSMVVTIIVVLVLTVGSFFLYRGRHKQRWLPRLAGSAATIAALCLLVFGVYLQPLSRRCWALRRMHGCRTATTATTV